MRLPYGSLFDGAGIADVFFKPSALLEQHFHFLYYFFLFFQERNANTYSSNIFINSEGSIANVFEDSKSFMFLVII